MNPRAAGRSYMIGLDGREIEWVRLLVKLLRDPDPLAPELARQALEYIHNVARAGSRETAMRPAVER